MAATAHDALILGAGISGLAAARTLARAGLAPVVIEAAAAPGGTLASERRGGFLVELGPNTVQESPALLALAEDAGCAADLIGASPAAKQRFVVHRGRLTPLPAGPPGLFTTPLLTFRGKGRLATEPWRRRGPGPHESVAAFFGRRFGAETLPLADALGLGIYAGDPEELAIGFAFRRAYALEREHGSLLRGLARARRGALGRRPPRLVAYRGGFGALAARLAGGLDLRCGWRAIAVRRQGEEFAVELRRGEERLALATRRLVVALPAASTAQVLAPLGPRAAQAAQAGTAEALSPIAELPHAPVAVIALGYERGRVAHPLDGFGFLAPHREGRRILGCLFSSTLFSDCAPAGSVLLTAMAGGRRRPALVEGSDAELVELVRGELGELLGVRGEPAMTLVRRWRPGIPQPDARWPRVREAALALERAHPGLTLLGGWLHGVGVPECARAGWEVAAR